MFTLLFMEVCVCGGGGGGNGEGGGGLAAGCENCRPVDSGRTQAKKLKNFVSSSSTWKGFSSKIHSIEKYVALAEALHYVHRIRRLIKDREPRTSTSTFTQLLGSVTSTETVGLLGTGSPGHPPRLLHSSWALMKSMLQAGNIFRLQACALARLHRKT